MLHACQHGVAPLLRGETPKDWRTSVYYRYYHSPGHHNTAAHLGVRTATHKLIHYWKADAYELFDLTKDPTEQRNLLHSASDATKPEVAAKFAELKTELVTNDGGKTASPARLVSMEEMERTHIGEILRHTGGQIGGRGGAAEILDLPVSTLRSRMKKLGIRVAHSS